MLLKFIHFFGVDRNKVTLYISKCLLNNAGEPHRRDSSEPATITRAPERRKVTTMKKTLIALTAVAVLLSAMPAMAQDDDFTFSFAGKGGWFFFQDDPMSDIVENNWMVGGELILWMPSGLGFGADVRFATRDKDAEDIDNYDFDMEWTQVPININAYYRVDTGEEYMPYFGAGFTAAWTDISVIEPGFEDISVDDTAIGFNALVGIEYNGLLVEGQYFWAEADFDELDFLKEDIDDKLNVGGFVVSVGYRF